jgi:hypothetical protein
MRPNFYIALFFVLGFFSPFHGLIAQSKKEQIEVLNGQVDSLSRILLSERGLASQRIEVKENHIFSLQSQIQKLKDNLENETNKLNTLKIANDSLSFVSDSLFSVIENSPASLDKEIFKWLKQHFFDAEEARWKYCNWTYSDEYGEVYNSDAEEIKKILENVHIEQKDINQDGFLDAIVSISVPFCSYVIAWENTYYVIIYSNGEKYTQYNRLGQGEVEDLLYHDLRTNKSLDVEGVDVSFGSFSSDGTLKGSAYIWLNEPFLGRRYPTHYAYVNYHPFTGKWSYQLESNNIP